jgi:ABC-type sulfate/molybdate transport systems ATPase subunit
VLGPKFNLIPGVNEMKYLAQDFDLMPFITVAENVGKFLSNCNPIEKQNRIAELLETVEMTNFAHTKAQYLSGGQMQRVAIARVLALEPKVLLLDEPFSHIDNFRKNALRRNLFAYLKNKNISCIVATHDCVDALSFADETLIIKDGQVVQKDVSRVVYENPKNRYVASLFGEVNQIDKSVLCYPHQLVVCEDGKLRVHVRKSYFKGTHFLIKAVQDKNIIFFEHKTEIKFNEVVFLDLRK